MPTPVKPHARLAGGTRQSYVVEMVMAVNWYNCDAMTTVKIGTWKIGQIATQNDLTILSCRYSGNAVIEVHHYALIPLSTCGPRVLQRDPMGLPI